MKCRFSLVLFLVYLMSVVLAGCTNTAGNNSVYHQNETNPTAIQTTAHTDMYTISYADGRYVLTFTDKMDEIMENGELLNQIVVKHPSFSSAEEMRSRIISSDLGFSAEEMAVLYTYTKGEPMEICGPDDLYDVRLPEDLQLGSIVWYGYTYEFNLEGDFGFGGMVEPVSQEEFQDTLHKEYTAFPYENFIVISENEIPDRNAREVIFETSTARIRSVLYEVDIDDGTIFIREDYPLEYFIDVEYTANETVPNRVFLYGQQADACFTGELLYPNERPSEQWLASFGLEKMSLGN